MRIAILALGILALASCSGVAGPGALPASPWAATLPGAAAKNAAFKALFQFDGADGAAPYANLTDVNGALYGTTYSGGANGVGVVFKITTAGVERPIYSFKGGSDGEYPAAGLANVNGTLYGTTSYGGTSSDGTVFKITTAGVEKVIHSFGGGNGQYPNALIDVSGTLYGTTNSGGTSGFGTVFKITTSGSEKVLHSFKRVTHGTDGMYPEAPLLDVGGTLFGTTTRGGKKNVGTVFSITTSGTERVLYSFKAGGDGADPFCGLADVGGILFGTTNLGGVNGLGIVFEVTTAGSETVFYSFKGGADGANPYAGLTEVNGALYGTTYRGSASGCSGSGGCGTIFKITTSGAESVLHAFKGTDGANPYAGVTNVNGTLYGTTLNGGAGYGTVFKTSP